jgi:hypothetical protein
VGLPGKVAHNGGDGDVNTNGVDAGGGGGGEVDGDVKRSTARLVSKAVLDLPVDMVLGASEQGEGGEMLEENEQRVPNVVV